MASPGSVTNWIRLAKDGDPIAAQCLWERYFERLVTLARKHLACAADREDVVLSVFDSFFRNARQERFPLLDDREGLWRLLVTKVAFKAIDQLRHQRTQKNGGGCVISLADEELQEVLANEPTPAFAMEVAEECERLLDLLPRQDLRQIAVWKMEGYTREEIASRLGCVAKSVQRRLQVIRTLWKSEVLP